MRKTLIILLVVLVFLFAIQSTAGDLAFERARNKALTEGVDDGNAYAIVNSNGTKGIKYVPKENVLVLFIYNGGELVCRVLIAESRGLYGKKMGEGETQDLTQEEAHDFAYQFMENFNR